MVRLQTHGSRYSSFDFSFCCSVAVFILLVLNATYVLSYEPREESSTKLNINEDLSYNVSN